jgi:hypothetical protein
VSVPGTHRAPRGRFAEGLVSLGSLVGAGLLILVALAVASLIPRSDADVEHQQRPFAVRGGVGDTRSTRALDIRVLGVRGAGKITDGDRTHDTGGVWVIVKVRVATRTEAGLIPYAAVRDDRGRTFWHSARIEQPLDGRFIQPGIPLTGELVFEVPKDAATHLTALFADNSLDQRMDRQVEIALPTVDRATVDGWAATPPTALMETEVSP